MGDVKVTDKPTRRPDIVNYAPKVAIRLTQEQHYDRVLRLKHELNEANREKPKPPIIDIIDVNRIRPDSVKLAQPKALETLPKSANLHDPSIAIAHIYEDVSTTPMSIAEYPCEKLHSSHKDFVKEFNKLLVNVTKTTQEERVNVENLTRGQRENSIWFEQRKGAFTASNFGRIMKCSERGAKRLAEDIIGYTNKTQTKVPLPIRWGIKNEEKAIDLYLKQFSSTHSDVEFRKTGLYIHPNFGYLRASPDGLLSCSCHGERLVEVKCPYAYRDKNLSEMFADNAIEYMDITMEQPLKKGHTRGYFEQVTGQMAVTGIQMCDFVMYSKKGIISLPVTFDKYYWEMVMLPKLARAFKAYIVPELVKIRIENELHAQQVDKNSTESASSE